MEEVTNPPAEAVSGSGLVIDVAQPDAPVTALAPIERAQVALLSVDTEFQALTLASKHNELVLIKDRAGREQVHGAAMELMRFRTAINNRADDVREDAKKFNAAVIAEQKRLVALIEPEEKRLKALRDAWDAEQERIKREAEEKERARVLALGARIQEIRGFARLAQDCRSSDAVRRLVDRLATIDMTGFEEFEAEAINALTETRQQVENTLNARLATEAEAARLKAEREELARQQAEAKQKADELAAQQKAETDKLAAERAEFARQQQEAADKLAEQQAEVERMRVELAVTAAAVGRSKKFTDAMAVAAEHGGDKPIVMVDSLEVEFKGSTGDATQHAAQIAGYELVTGMRSTRGADLVDTVSMHDDGTSSAPDAGVPWDTSTESAEVRLGFDMAMSMPITTRAAAPADDTPPAASLIGAIAQAYGVDNETACHWLCVRADDFLEWVDTSTTA